MEMARWVGWIGLCVYGRIAGLTLGFIVSLDREWV